MAGPPTLPIEVRAELVFEVREPTTLALHLALARSVERVDEVVELDADHASADMVTFDGNRVYVVQSEAGALAVRYRARALGGAVDPTPLSPFERIVALRQSRYAPSDLIEGFAETELGHLRGDPSAGLEVAAWVHRRLRYVPGSSGPNDSALDTLHGGEGVCRDYAHLTVLLCRALGVPARFVAVYAPGLSPMDFHAVAEVGGPDGWEIVDATRLAPRQSLLRIATGRDAADTALVSTLEGHAELLESTVGAWVDGDLPVDDHTERIAIAWRPGG